MTAEEEVVLLREALRPVMAHDVAQYGHMRVKPEIVKAVCETRRLVEKLDAKKLKDDRPTASKTEIVSERMLWSSEMPVRYVHLLAKEGYKTFEDLERVEGHELLKIVGLGLKSLDEIRKVMKRYGFYFAMERKVLGLVPGGAGPQGA